MCLMAREVFCGGWGKRGKGRVRDKCGGDGMGWDGDG